MTARIETRVSRVLGALALIGIGTVLLEGRLCAQNPPPLPELPPALIQSRPAESSFLEKPVRDDITIEVRLGHGRILDLKQDLFAGGKDLPAIAVGDPGVLEFTPLSSRRIRLQGMRLGATDLSVTTADGRTLTFEVIVSADLNLIQARLRQAFPDTSVKLSQVGDHLIVEGQARSPAQIVQIIELLQTSVTSSIDLTSAVPSAILPAGEPATPAPPAPPSGSATGGGPIKILNLLRIPGSQQVLLKVRVAELNRTALRQIGGNVLGYDSKSGSIFGTQIDNAVTAKALVDYPKIAKTAVKRTSGLVGTATSTLGASGTVFGIFQSSNFDIFLNALRRNSVLKILAEPNLMALNGQKASFHAGGEFPVPVPQVGASGVAPTITVDFKKFGVQLDFLPVILEGEAIRLTVEPEVSSVDFSIGTTLVVGGSQVPGVNTRSAHTTVELKSGQTLAIAGLLQVTLNGTTNRIPGLGDLPVLGSLFSNTTNDRIEKELVILVTPYLVEPLNCDQVPPGPGDEVGAPNDLEFYFLNRIEGRTGRDFRATTDGADPLRLAKHLKLERKYVRGPVGYSD